MINTLATIGGIFAVLTFIHFVVDWIFQSHSEAMQKHNNPKVRAKHCLIYTLGFVPILLCFNYTWLEWLLAVNILFWSHFFEDTYLPVFFWAKYVRRPPEFDMVGKQPDLSGHYPQNDKEAFVQFIMTPLGKILMITVDQIIHLAFLFPIVWMAIN